MNDRYLFRVWNGYQYLYNCALQNGVPSLETDAVNGKRVLVDDEQYYSDWATYKIVYMIGSKTEYALIEQCTGQKDKNGKLAFFGDVITNGKFKAELIRHENGGIGMKMGSGAVSTLDARFIEDLKIIGNIHDDKKAVK